MNQFAPLLISSPVRRSGTTLLQRLLCSAPNTLIYGENCAHELSMLINIMMTRQMQFQYGLQERDEMLHQVLAGNTDEWIADLMPEMSGYTQQLHSAYLSVMNYYPEFAAQKQRPIWGMKMAEWAAQNLIQTLRHLPDSKLIYIIRPLEACARSSKTIGQIHSINDLHLFCNTWLQQLQTIITHAPAEQLLLIDYTAFLESPAKYIQELESFSGARGIQQEVLHRRINTYTTDKEGDPSGQGYLSPSELSAQELELIATFREKKKEWMKQQE